MTHPVIVIVGPTAVGKTDLSLDVAEHIDAHIINADSMQLYRGMDIGTAKVPFHQRRGIPHHLLDVLEVTEAANVADYQRQARAAVHEIQSAGKEVVVVGGSGLFIQALLEDLQFPGSDPEIRQKLIRQAEDVGTFAMYERLVDLAPDAAKNILPTNLRRIIRALEVIELTGGPPQTSLEKLSPIIPSIRIGLQRPRDELDNRIAQRVGQMWDIGFVQEVQHLSGVGLRDGLTASKALGYAQVLEALDGKCSMDEAKALTIAATRKYARRQESWFKRDHEIHWLDAQMANATKVVELIARANARTLE